jgi:hypothetical protein
VLQAELLIGQIAGTGFTLEQLIAFRDGGELPGNITPREYIPTVRRSYKGSTLQVWDSYFEFIDIGEPSLCRPCLDAYRQTMANRNRKDPAPTGRALPLRRELRVPRRPASRRRRGQLR